MGRRVAEEAFTTVTVPETVRFFVRGLPLALLFAAAACAGVWFAFRTEPLTFTATANLISVRQDRQPTVVRSVVAGSLDPTLYRTAVVNGPVLAAVQADWSGVHPLPDRKELLEDLRVLSDNQLQSSIVRVEYRSSDAQLSADVANAVAEELLSWDRERTARPLRDGRARLRERIHELEETLTADTGTPARLAAAEEEHAQLVRELAELESVLPVAQLSELSVATPPAAPDSRGLLFAFSIAAVSGAFAAYGLRLLRAAA